MEIVLGILATYRLARLVSMEEGPFSVFERFRAWVDPAGTQATSWARGVNCPLCVGVWAAALVTIFMPRERRNPVTWLAIAGGQTLLHLWGEK